MIFVPRTGFLGAGIVHAVPAICGIVIDLGPGRRLRRRVEAGLGALATVTIASGIALPIAPAGRC